MPTNETRRDVPRLIAPHLLGEIGQIPAGWSVLRLVHNQNQTQLGLVHGAIMVTSEAPAVGTEILYATAQGLVGVLRLMVHAVQPAIVCAAGYQDLNVLECHVSIME